MGENGVKHKILLVDDDSFLSGLYSMKFADAGYDVQLFAAVKDALEAIRKGFIPEVILFDIVMNDKDGFALLQTLRDENLAPDAYKIALTNQPEDIDKARAMELGASQYIVKANTIPAEVVALVGEILAKKGK